jgi:hypothetical protein
MSAVRDADCPRAALPVFGLPPTGAWLWLVRPDAIETAAATCLVLFNHLPGLLVALGAGFARHG